MIRTKLIPREPGVYLFKDQAGKVLYVGKAKILRNRVTSYFNKNQSQKIRQMIAKANDIDYFIVDNEVEALLLENRLIKQYRPPYNIRLKDAKTFAYIRITDEKFPRILSTRDVSRNGIHFGPYTDGYMRREMQALAVALFRLRTCKRMPKRACLNYHIELCSGPCAGHITKDDYQKSIDEAKVFLDGNKKSIIRKLKTRMQEASKSQRYERALEIKKLLGRVEHAGDDQKVDLIKKKDQDVVAKYTRDGIARFALFRIHRGVISGKKEYSFEDEPDIFGSFIKMYYSKNPVPHEVIVSNMFWSGEEEKGLLEKYLARFKGQGVTLTFPQRGQKLALVRMVKKNAATGSELGLELMHRLDLPRAPGIIECFDISNFGSEGIVAGMTRWKDSLPDTDGYARFQIRTVMGKSDDVASIREAVRRRYRRLIYEKRVLPELVLIDGGKGQRNAAADEIKKLGLDIPVISLAKQNEEIYMKAYSEPLQFDVNSPMMILLRRIRDATHNFAISYNKKRREIKFRDETRDL